MSAKVGFVASQVLNNFINGEYAAATAGQTSAVVDPSTGEEYARAPVSGPDDVEAALGAAAGAFQGWRGPPTLITRQPAGRNSMRSRNGGRGRRLPAPGRGVIQ